MPTGSRANRANGVTVSTPSRPSRRVREIGVLLEAWHAIRRNGETSSSPKTRQDTKDFDTDLPRRLRRIQERLRRAPYVFARQFGVVQSKEKGKGKRPLVISPIEDRVVQRAILDVLQTSADMPGVRKVLATPTSIGGIPERGVTNAISLIECARKAGNANFIAGSDIEGFFTRIDQLSVTSFISEQTDDKEFIELFRHALKVDLANADKINPSFLGLFPTDDIGVAQGCPLSALAGNIVLHDFDTKLNGRGITCIRYIDDFILLGRKKEAVLRAFKSARVYLTKLGMNAYDPQIRPDKAFFGPLDQGLEFLGYKLIPPTYPPSDKNQEAIIASVRTEFEEGRRDILRVLNGRAPDRPLQYYAQTMAAVDRLVRAWSHSFNASRCLETARQIDEEVNSLTRNFIAFYQANTKTRTIAERRRALGIHLLSDDVLRRQDNDAMSNTNGGRREI